MRGVQKQKKKVRMTEKNIDFDQFYIDFEISLKYFCILRLGLADAKSID